MVCVESETRSSALSRVIDRLKADFGDRADTGLALREQHGRGESHHGTLAPDIVVFPNSTAEVASIVRICADDGIPIVPFGAGTSLEGNVSAVYGGVTIDLSRMTRIIRVGTEDLDCTVEAGGTRQQLNSYLRDKGLFFPIDPGGEATIGGMAATRASGTNAVRYGTMREAVLSLTVVIATGKIIRTAQRARKSSAGYDLTRLFVGSEGTLGVITEVTIRLHGIPEAVDVAVVTFGDLKSAIDTTVALIQSGVPVARVELLDDAQMKAINAYAKTDHPVRPTLFLEFHGGSQSVVEQRETAMALADEFGAKSFRTADNAEECTALWRARHQAFYATVALRPNSKGWSSDVCVPISRLSECISATKEMLSESLIPATIVGHVGDGNFHVIFNVMTEDSTEMQEVSRINAKIIKLAISLEGTCTGEHGVGTGKIAYMEAEHGDALDIMSALKAALDPKNIFNPGKIIPPERLVKSYATI